MIRRLLATVALAGLVLVSGCNESDGSGESASGGGTTTGSTATSAPPSAADNTKKVCDDMKALAAELTAKVTALLQRAVQESVAGDEATAEKTFAELNAVAVEYAGKVEAIGQTASNTELKQALLAMATEMRAAEGEDLDSAITAGEGRYKAICGA
jgi:hypothetical protein